MSCIANRTTENADEISPPFYSYIERPCTLSTAAAGADFLSKFLEDVILIRMSQLPIPDWSGDDLWSKAPERIQDLNDPRVLDEIKNVRTDNVDDNLLETRFVWRDWRHDFLDDLGKYRRVPVFSCPLRELLGRQRLQWIDPKFVSRDEHSHVVKRNVLCRFCVVRFIPCGFRNSLALDCSPIVIFPKIEIGKNPFNCLWGVFLDSDRSFSVFLKKSANEIDKSTVVFSVDYTLKPSQIALLKYFDWVQTIARWTLKVIPWQIISISENCPRRSKSRITSWISADVDMLSSLMVDGVSRDQIIFQTSWEPRQV